MQFLRSWFFVDNFPRVSCCRVGARTSMFRLQMITTSLQREVLVDSYIHQSGDRSVRERLPFFTAAYLAFRIGYATMNQFHAQAERYRNLLEREVTASV